MQLAEDYVRYLCQYLLDHCAEDLELMRKLYDKTCIDRLTAVASTPFGRVSYTEAIDILSKVCLTNPASVNCISGRV
jgi:asparaginyl-tRNA synthetase